MSEAGIAEAFSLRPPISSIRRNEALFRNHGDRVRVGASAFLSGSIAAEFLQGPVSSAPPSRASFLIGFTRTLPACLCAISDSEGAAIRFATRFTRTIWRIWCASKSGVIRLLVATYNLGGGVSNSMSLGSADSLVR